MTHLRVPVPDVTAASIEKEAARSGVSLAEIVRRALRDAGHPVPEVAKPGRPVRKVIDSGVV